MKLQVPNKAPPPGPKTCQVDAALDNVFFLIFINLVLIMNLSTGDSKTLTHRILPAGQQHVGFPQCSTLELILAQVFTASPVAGAVFQGLSISVSLPLSLSRSVSVSSYVCVCGGGLVFRASPVAGALF